MWTHPRNFAHVAHEDRTRVVITRTILLDAEAVNSEREEPIEVRLQLNTKLIRRLPSKLSYFRDFVENSEFPIMKEYRIVKEYYEELKARTQKEQESDDLFDDL